MRITIQNSRQTRCVVASACISIVLLSSGCSTGGDTSTTPNAASNRTEMNTQAQVQMKDISNGQPIPSPMLTPQVMLESEADTAGDELLTRLADSNQASAVKSFTSPPTKLRMHQDINIAPIENTEKYQQLQSNPVVRVADQSTSTFSIDVDTGAYSNVRRFLKTGQLPPADAIRVEEMLNYFTYDYPVPESTSTPFAIHTELGVTPWNSHTRLLHIGLKGYNVEPDNRPAANLVFLLDVSGSMAADNKLGLLKASINMLTRELNEADRVSIVVYAGASGVVLEPTAGDDHKTIAHALNQLQAGGSTNGQAGIELAYTMAEKSMTGDSINRIILATDGDFNVGISNIDSLKSLIETKRKSGIALTTLGFGTGNYNDHLMEQLANVGNGSYAYIDTLNEARKVLSEEITSTLLTIAKDVKIQIEFNPAHVSEYRLLGYVNRRLANEDFANDKVDAGEIGAGHTVTALYELALRGDGGEWHTESRYQPGKAQTPLNDEIAEIRLRYKQPDESKSQLVKRLVQRSTAVTELTDASTNFQFSAAVAGFGQLLRQSKYLVDFDYSDASALATSAKGDDQFGYRSELVQLINLAENLDQSRQSNLREQSNRKTEKNEG